MNPGQLNGMRLDGILRETWLAEGQQLDWGLIVEDGTLGRLYNKNRQGDGIQFDVVWCLYVLMKELVSFSVCARCWRWRRGMSLEVRDRVGGGGGGRGGRMEGLTRRGGVLGTAVSSCKMVILPDQNEGRRKREVSDRHGILRDLGTRSQSGCLVLLIRHRRIC